MTSYTLTPAQCKALLLHIPKSDIRFYLIGAHVAPDGIVSATDGHRALRIRVGMDGPGTEGIIPRELIAQGAKLKHAAVFEVADGAATLLGVNVRMQLVDGKFPDVNRVCPMAEPAAVHAHAGEFNLRYHLEAREALDLLTRGTSVPKDIARPVKWRSTQAADVHGTGFFHAEGVAMVLSPLRPEATRV